MPEVTPTAPTAPPEPPPEPSILSVCDVLEAELAETSPKVTFPQEYLDAKLAHHDAMLKLEPVRRFSRDDPRRHPLQITCDTAENLRLNLLAPMLHGQRRAALCFSGGGIRSATFALGVLQALSRHKLLEKFHYLSTVSGGGYIGSWLSAWRTRASIADI